MDKFSNVIKAILMTKAATVSFTTSYINYFAWNVEVTACIHITYACSYLQKTVSEFGGGLSVARLATMGQHLLASGYLLRLNVTIVFKHNRYIFDNQYDWNSNVVVTLMAALCARVCLGKKLLSLGLVLCRRLPINANMTTSPVRRVLVKKPLK